MKRAAEFFAGIGLVRMALERTGWQVVFANDIDSKKLDIYQENFGSNEFVLSDVRKINANGIPDIDLATASFPCIDLSLAGNRAGLKGEHSSAYWGFFEILNRMGNRRPEVVLLENVLGLVSSHRGRDLRHIVESLNQLGYWCDLLIVDAAHFIPQSRPRLFVVGALEPSNRQFLVAPHPARTPLLMNFIHSNSDLIWSHSSLPPFPKRRACLDDIVESLPAEDLRWWDKRRRQHLFQQMSPLHRARLAELMRSPRPMYATVYKRVRPTGCKAELRDDGLAGCLRTPRGGSSKQFLIRACCGDWRVRTMTPREYARLQGVPDAFRIAVPDNQALFGFGDAVCVPAVEWVIRNAINSQEEHELRRKSDEVCQEQVV